MALAPLARRAWRRELTETEKRTILVISNETVASSTLVDEIRRRGDEGGHDGRYEPAGYERGGRGEDDQAGEQRHGEVHGERERASARGQ